MLSSTKKRSSFPTGAFPLSTSIHSAANLQVSQTQNGVTSLPSLSFFLPHHHQHSPFSERSARSHAVLGIVNGVLLCATVACRWSALIEPRAFAPNLKPLIPLLSMGITCHRRQEQEYSYLSYLHHVVLGLDEVDRLVPTVTEELGAHGLTTTFLFPAMPSTSALPEFIASSKSSSALVSFHASDAEHHGTIRLVRMYTPDLVKTCCKLGYSPSQWGDSRLTCIRTISRLGASGSTDAQAEAAIRRQFQEAHRPSS